MENNTHYVLLYYFSEDNIPACQAFDVALENVFQWIYWIA